MQVEPRDRRRTLWLALLSALLVLAIAQVDEHRRFRRASDAYVKQLASRAAQAMAYVDQLNAYLAKPPDERAAAPLPPPHFPEKAPPAPPAEKYMLIARIRRAVCTAAFAVAAALPVAWAMSTAEFARRNRRLIAEATLALALFGTLGMLLGWDYAANWKNFRIGGDAAGYGLVLVPLGAVAVVLAARTEAADSGAVAGDVAGAGAGAGAGASGVEAVGGGSNT